MRESFDGVGLLEQLWGRGLSFARPIGAYRRKLLALAYLASDLQDAILEDRRPPQSNLERLMALELLLA
ncbi:MAG: hypothetical protein WA840_11590 [Caulobacteraceae bacterium]